MHPDQVDVDVDLVRALLRAQHPYWAELPLRSLTSAGTVNAVFRLGNQLSVRLPLTASGVAALTLEAQWLPRIAPVVPLPTPTVGSPLATADAEVRAALESLRDTDETLDIDAILTVWARCVASAADRTPRCWIHSDLMPSNLLGADGRLTAVIDFGTVGLGDPAVDLIPAWNLLSPPGRRIFRNAVCVDDATWARGRGWALSMAAVQLPYYRTTNQVISGNARYVFGQILCD